MSVEIELHPDLKTDVPAPTGYVEMDPERCVAMFVLGDLQDALRKRGLKRIGCRNTLAILPRIIGKPGVMRRFKPSTSRTFFAAMMGKAESSLLPYSLTMEPIVYCFDCWAPDYSWWVSFFKRYRIRTAFFSARASASFFAKALPGLSATWVPEATDLDQYTQGPELISRSIDVLELGRRYDWFHTRVVGPLRTAERSHLYEVPDKIKGKKSTGVTATRLGRGLTNPDLLGFHGNKLYTDRAKLRAGLAESKISICFPKSITHPEVAGKVETVTHRYFESMASGCLLYGHCPDELKTLFGYNPVIEMDVDDPARQILNLLSEIDTYQPMVQRNYQRMRQIGTWDSRVSQILDGLLLNQIGNQALAAS